MKKKMAVIVVSVVALWLGVIVFLPVSGYYWRGRWARYTGGGRYVGCAPSMSSSGQIAYSSPRSGRGDIYTCRSDGTNSRRLTEDPNYEGDPAWSADGRRIAFAREANGIAHIWIINADGTSQMQVSRDRGYDSGPCFSPDGSRLVFTRNVAEAKYLPWTSASAEIFVTNVDGTGETRLTRNEEAESGAKFSPDGKRIIYNVRSKEIWMMDQDGRGQQRVVNGSSPCFSPDGKDIALIDAPAGDYQYDIFEVNLATRRTRRLTNTGGYKSSPSFSPNGIQVMFLTEPTARGTGTIKILDLSDMSTKKVETTD
ncbi:MAG: TolB family protein [Pirellulaceae bacterium]